MSRNNYGLSRYIPIAIERRVREEAGYGCAICGQIFVHLHHFNPPFESAEQHNPDRIIPLCPDHHSAASSFSDSDMQDFKGDPFCKQAGVVHEQFITSPENVNIIIGSNLFSGNYFCFVIDGLPIFWHQPQFAGQPISMNAIFRDQNFQPILTIRENVILKRVDGVPIRRIENRYVVGEARDPIIEIRIVDRNNFEIRRLSAHGIETDYTINPESISFSGGGRMAHNHYGGINFKTGVYPQLRDDLFDGLSDYEVITNGDGATVGFLQNTRIFDVRQNIRGEIDERMFARRVFLNSRMELFREHPIGRLVNGLVLAHPFDDEFPSLPYPPSTLQVDKQGNVCISDFFCSPRMPGMISEPGPFATLSRT